MLIMLNHVIFGHSGWSHHRNEISWYAFEETVFGDGNESEMN